ncbi:MAG: hypothetical protein P0Y49_13965 [Candidatus Pedobacter colombiensis]|uniref:Uncharacterized protein n=1 Tax=Candidatus Pedobacter colombiensis TaxID=3121371 RepID=A0AAJ5W688_9SPHI|nr:hypothetical protein [Pedobacter sp.]WEK17905.1 MAG: hypothetical protein P0Y49_13965 [Pedobacter sp.]
MVMQTVLKEKLQAYITVNNPEVLNELQAGLSVSAYLEDKVSAVMPLVLHLLEEGKPSYIIEELALKEMTASLRPSKFNYIKELLESDFLDSYQAFSTAGVLTYECINLIEACKDIFETFSFSEDNEDDRFLKYAVIAKIHEYLN